MINESGSLEHFFSAIERDPRISLMHIGLYAALLRCWQLAGRQNPFGIYSYQMMQLAKFSSRTTYSKLIGDLKDFGYLRYAPSCKPQVASQVELIF